MIGLIIEIRNLAVQYVSELGLFKKMGMKIPKE
jgi:hypothetical protein